MEAMGSLGLQASQDLDTVTSWAYVSPLWGWGRGG